LFISTSESEEKTGRLTGREKRKRNGEGFPRGQDRKEEKKKRGLRYSSAEKKKGVKRDDGGEGGKEGRKGFSF